MKPAAALRLTDLHPEPSDFLSEVLSGLGSRPKTLPCKYLYDQRGSQLFEEICELEEYYPTRTELSIMDAHAPEMARRIGPESLLVEFGSGSSVKTRQLLDHLEDPAGYVPIDISREHLLRSAADLARDYPDLGVLPVCADFTRPLDLPDPGKPVRRRVVYFPGSTIGNFTPAEAIDLLSTIASDCGDEGGLLIGVDLRKDPEILERAYDDARGVTAAFNRNLLVRINDELGADFDLDKFEHEARWSASEGRVEMHLVSQEDQSVRLGKSSFDFGPGESIHTESSYKYEPGQFARLAEKAGLCREEIWVDDEGLFSVQLFNACDD
jgi:dimethylhistidine N-methyltransferase